MKQEPSDPKRAVGYARVSTDDQDLGPEAQRAEVERWCQQHGVELVAFFEDRGVSGGAPVEKRPGLLQALDSLKSTGAGLLVVAKRDRLARDVFLTAMVERLAIRHGAKVIAANGAGNGDGPEDRLMGQMIDAFAEYERALIRSRTRSALAVKKARQERVGGIPYGWRLDEDGVHLIADPREQRILAMVRRMHARGLSLREIGRSLEEKGWTPRTGARWHAKTVRGALHAPEAVS